MPTKLTHDTTLIMLNPSRVCPTLTHPHRNKSLEIPALKVELLAIREPAFNYNTQEIIPRMGLVLIRSPSPLDDSSRNLRELINKVGGGGLGLGA